MALSMKKSDKTTQVVLFLLLQWSIAYLRKRSRTVLLVVSLACYFQKAPSVCCAACSTLLLSREMDICLTRTSVFCYNLLIAIHQFRWPRCQSSSRSRSRCTQEIPHWSKDALTVENGPNPMNLPPNRTPRSIFSYLSVYLSISPSIDR